VPKVSQLKTASQIAAEELADPEIRREHERTALAHAVARASSATGSTTNCRRPRLRGCSACSSPR